jgi:hypothetical protein
MLPTVRCSAVIMSRRPPTFRQADVTRAVKAAKAAGIKVTRVEITKDGKIAIVTSEQVPADECDELDKWVKIHANET